jgi:hypothetical protein
MTEQSTDLTVRKSITVDVPQQRAFDVFTGRMTEWWPLESHHIGAQPAQEAVLEPRDGGRWYERAADGSECEWGRVLAWSPPERVTLAWMIGPTWQYDPDPATATEVEVRFVAEGEARTRVELEHRGLEKLGEAGAQLSATFSGEGGWGMLLELYAGVTKAAGGAAS